ncbi:MAG: hypothetical protein P8O16_03810 [Algoriphagus sp.]|jgi:hypothetical protein|uniref:hypothetical protein n=1 Tax=Algoriphagus sp. TaxID=1872435 RepID=UPI00261D86E3|nr:hypothetical protein [Algoriphagus sp.]MDG1276380.1 hypothetical protein [Algoriphagus sp.]
MRVVKEFIIDEIRISVFSWNNKFILKYEFGPMEQTFKVSELDILEETDLDSFLEGEFFEKVKLRFEEMGDSFRSEMEKL